MLSLILWVVRKARHDHEGLLALLIAARKLEEDRIYASMIFRAGYRVGQLNPCKPIDDFKGPQ